MWPRGVNSASHVKDRYDYLVQFNGRPWAERGTLGIKYVLVCTDRSLLFIVACRAMRLILALFTVLGGHAHASGLRDQVYIIHLIIERVD